MNNVTIGNVNNHGAVMHIAEGANIHIKPRGKLPTNGSLKDGRNFLSLIGLRGVGEKRDNLESSAIQQG